MVINPNAFIEASAEVAVTFKLAVVEFTLNLKALVGKYTPFDYQLAWDLDEKSRYCQGLGFFFEVFDFGVSTEWNINECYFGLIGALLPSLNLSYVRQNLNYCTWRTYQPQLMLYEYTLQDRGDVAQDYIPWECNDYSELQTGTVADENGNSLENPISYDDLLEEEEGVMWDYDPTNVVID